MMRVKKACRCPIRMPRVVFVSGSARARASAPRLLVRGRRGAGARGAGGPPRRRRGATAVQRWSVPQQVQVGAAAERAWGVCADRVRAYPRGWAGGVDADLGDGTALKSGRADGED